MIRILDRLVFTTFIRLFVLVLAACPPLFIIGDIAEKLDDYIDRGLTGSEVAQAYLYQLPLFIQWSFPIAALLATVFTVHSMTVHREIVGAKAGGISFHRLIAPILVAGVGLTVIALGLSEVVPRGNRISAQILRSETPGRSWRSDFVYRSEAGLTWQVSRLTASDGRMTGLVLERPPTEDQPGMHVLADAASFSDAEGWTLSQGYLRTLSADSTERTVEFDRMVMQGVTERPEELLEAPRQPEEMTYAEIDRLARIVERTGGNARELLVKREQKISIPVATLVIILFGAPLATSNKRGGAAYGIGLSLATVLVYIMMLRVSGALGEAGALSPMMAAWLPNGLFAIAALFFMARVRT
ncbi:MAG: LptF/LptG family permease [Gemmatimonadetes bacterium]|nr:LptF/LptG family permease [Gemmatimonadota bacterium]MDA1104491.1 LptF/LptG family permease [Gemmatimonadota bacterium]